MNSPLGVRAGLAAARAWLSLPRTTRAEAWRLARENRAHPEPAIQASAVGWHRTATRAHAYVAVALLSPWIFVLLPSTWTGSDQTWPSLMIAGTAAAFVGMGRWTQRLGLLVAPNLWALAAARREANPARVRASGVSTVLPSVLTLTMAARIFEVAREDGDFVISGAMVLMVLATWAWVIAMPDLINLPIGRTVFHISETGVRIPRWRLDIPWEQIDGVNLAWHMGGRSRALGLAFQLRDPEAVWQSSGLRPISRRLLKSAQRHEANWIFVPAWGLCGPIDGPLSAAIHHHLASRAAGVSRAADV